MVLLFFCVSLLDLFAKEAYIQLHFVSSATRPSPAAAAKGKVARCYSGPLTTRTVASMVKCDSHGPLVIHVAKLYAEPDGQSFSAFGRIYSGTVKPGEHVLPYLQYALTLD